MKENFTYTLLEDWSAPELYSSGSPGAERNRSRVNHAALSGLEPHQKLLLLSDGSLTIEMELLYGSKVEVDFIYRGHTVLSPDEADYLLEDQENESIEREVWLTVQGKRLIYARTLIPLKCLDKKLMNELGAKSGEPIGRVLSTNRIPFRKEGLEIGMVRCPSVASGFGSDPSTPMFARRYLLSNSDYDTKMVIKASVMEFFSPEVVPVTTPELLKG